jgi:curved DNA-binding protein CbpA
MRRAAFRMPHARATSTGGFVAATLRHAQRCFAAADQPDFYKTLGVSPSSTVEDVKAAYKKLALELHPDRNKSPDAEERFKRVSEAYSVLKDKNKRQEYDNQRQYFASTGSPQYESGQNRGFAHSQQQGGYTKVHTMSTADADKIFRELFGNVKLEDIFRDVDQRASNRRVGNQGVNVNLHRQWGGFSREQNAAFTPFFQQTTQQTYTDDAGNVRTDTSFKDAFGRLHRVSQASSTQENASMNTDPNEYYRAAAARHPQGRVEHASGYFNFKHRGATDDFFQHYMGVRSHGRHPAVLLLIVFCWFVIISSILYASLTFCIDNPLFVVAIFMLWALRRNRSNSNWSRR